MRHRKAGRKFGRNSSSRKAMFRNMVTSILRHEQVRTTEAKAKEVRRFVERVVTLGKNAPSVAAIEALPAEEQQEARAARVHAIRRARLWVNDVEVLRKVFGEYADRYQDRAGGYTRVIKAGVRAGDNAPMAVIELVRDADGSDHGEAATEEQAEA